MKSIQPSNPGEIVQDIKSFVKSIAERPVNKLITALRSDNHFGSESNSEVAMLTLIDLLEYAASQKEINAGIAETFLKIENHSDRIKITQIFTNNVGDFIRKGKGYHGRILISRNIDEELRDAFGEESSVLINLSHFPTLRP